MSVFSLEIHQEIARWQQEAKEEDTERYFFAVPQAQQLKAGEKCFLISRKGTGKTAIGQHILKDKSAGVRSASLNFKNFPFNELYGPLQDRAYRRPNQFISGWRFLIYCNVARLMAEDETVAPSVREVARELFVPDVKTTLAHQIARWISGSFTLKFAGFGIGSEVVREFADNNASFTQRADALRDFILPAIGGSRYYLVFDELDDDYHPDSTAAERAEYLALLTSLLKAVRLVREESGGARSQILPIVLLRDDIFRHLRDSDRTKWLDRAVVLNWSLPQIRKLVAFRLSRAAGLAPEWDFARIWPELTGRHTFFTPRSKAWDKFDFISSYTLLRPRDFVFYLGDASRRISEKMQAGEGRGILSGEVLKECIHDFATHLKWELEDEICGQLPSIEAVLNMILGLGERHFTVREFSVAYERARRHSANGGWRDDPKGVLELLYRFSVIGFTKGKQEVFRYQSPNIDIDLGRTMLLHKGLLGARSSLK